MAATPESYTRAIGMMNEVLDALRDEPDPDDTLPLSPIGSRSNARSRKGRSHAASGGWSVPGSNR